MSDPSWKKTTKREFLKILGLSSASLLGSGSLADELLAEARGGTIPVVVMMKPNAFRSGRSACFSSILVFPEGYQATDVDVSSVRCEGARSLGSICDPNSRSIAILYNSDHLRDDLSCGFSVSFTVTGQLLDGTRFKGSGKVAVIGREQSVIYHTSTRKRRSCGACKSHALNRMYFSRPAADGDRAHPGCNCRIVEERIGWQNYVKAFWPSTWPGAAVYDRRWGWPPPSPAGLDLGQPPGLLVH